MTSWRGGSVAAARRAAARHEIRAGSAPAGARAAGRAGDDVGRPCAAGALRRPAPPISRPLWFQQISRPRGARGDGLYHVEQATGTIAWKNAARQTSIRTNGSCNSRATPRAKSSRWPRSAGLFQSKTSRIEVIGGLGLAGQLLVRAAGASSDAVSTWLDRTPTIAYYEPNAILPLSQVPNDPSFGKSGA